MTKEEQQLLDRLPPTEPSRRHRHRDECRDNTNGSTRRFPILYTNNDETGVALEGEQLGVHRSLGRLARAGSIGAIAPLGQGRLHHARPELLGFLRCREWWYIAGRDWCVELDSVLCSRRRGLASGVTYATCHSLLGTAFFLFSITGLLPRLFFRGGPETCPSVRKSQGAKPSPFNRNEKKSIISRAATFFLTPASDAAESLPLQRLVVWKRKKRRGD